MWVYGDSGAIVPGFKCTAGQEWMFLVQREFHTALVSSFTIGGTDAIGAASHILGGGAGAGLPSAAAGSKWDVTRRGLVFLHLGINDAAGYTDRTTTPATFTATDANHQNGMVGAFRACLAALSSSGRAEAEAATLTGTWGTYTGSDVSVGTRNTTNPGDHADFSGVIFPSTGKVHLVINAFEPGTGTMATVTISVDGSVVKTVLGTSLQMRKQKTGASSNVVYSEYAVEIDASPGSHTVTVTHAGSSGQFLSIDCILLNNPTAPPIFVPQEWTPIANASGFTSGALPTLIANKAVLDPLYQAVCAEFPNVAYVPYTNYTASGLGNDGLHPNDRGHRQIADAYIAAIPLFLSLYDPDNLYQSLSSATAANSFIFSGTAGSSPATVTSGCDAMWYVGGGTVTSIAVDGHTTGATSGGFLLRAGHTMTITHSGAPAISAFDISA